MSFDNFFDEPKFDYESEKKKFIENLNFLKSMSLQEITLYKKWEEFNKDSYSMLQKASKFDILENNGLPRDVFNEEFFTFIGDILVEVIDEQNNREDNSLASNLERGLL